MANLTKSHKGYYGSVFYEEGTLVITVLHIRDHVSDECADAAQVQQTFEALVDEYLEDCAELGKEADKPYSGTFNVRVTEDVHRQAALMASQLDCSLNEVVRRALDVYLSLDAGQADAKAMYLTNEFTKHFQHNLLKASQELVERPGQWEGLTKSVRVFGPELRQYESVHDVIKRFDPGLSKVFSDDSGQNEDSIITIVESMN